MNRVCNNHNDLAFPWQGADALVGFFLMYLGPSDRDRNPTNLFPAGWGIFALIAGLTGYRPPPAAYILSIDRPGPIQHRFYHGRRPEVYEADERADGGVEIYYNSPSFLLTAGGIFLNSGYGNDQLTKYKQVAYAQATTLLPTRALDVKGRPDLNVKFEDLIRFEQFPSKKEKQCVFKNERSAVNTGVHLGFACGANLVIPVKWLRLARSQPTSIRDVNGWILLNFNKDLPDYGPLGFYVAAYRTPVAEPEQLEVRYGMVPQNVGLLYATEATDMSFDEFKKRILERNKFPDKFEWGGVYDFHTPHEQERVFRFWIRPEDHKYTPRIYDLNEYSSKDFTSLNLVEGVFLNATGKHDGFIEIYTPGCRSPLILDYRNPIQPIRADNINDCPKPWLERAQALYTQAVQLIEAGRQKEAVGPADEAVTLFRQLATISAAPLTTIVEYLVELSSKLCHVGGLCSEAINPIQTAVDLLRAFQPESDKQKDYLQLFASTVHILAVRLLEAGRKGEAVGPANEALMLYLRLGGMSDADVMTVAQHLLDLSADLYDYELYSESINPIQVALLLLREFQPQPDKQLDYWELFAISLITLARRLQKIGRVDAAKIYAQEAVIVYRQLTQVDSDKFGPLLKNAEELVTSLT